ncbi:MAG: helix-turn-helix transcriptional regulator [Clostridiales bacterium]|nr:helix-turn-helix transcriptional regulator [Clostridiales bacterium]
MDYKAMGLRIRQRRKDLHMTQETLARSSDVSASYVGHIERGLKHCSLDTFVMICNALKVSPEALLKESVPVDRPDLTDGLSDPEVEMLIDIVGVMRKYHNAKKRPRGV